jgi:hypothetical protein
MRWQDDWTSAPADGATFFDVWIFDLLSGHQFRVPDCVGNKVDGELRIIVGAGTSSPMDLASQLVCITHWMPLPEPPTHWMPLPEPPK